MNYDMTYCTGERTVPSRTTYVRDEPCPLRDTCERHMPWHERPKKHLPIPWFVDPPFEGDTCEHYKPLSKNTREGE